MNDVLVVGELNVDIILNDIAGFPEMGKEILASQMMTTLGSSSAIFASNLSSLGGCVSFLGKVGNDQFGDLIQEHLEKNGVETDLIIRSEKYQTGSTVVLNYDMDRANITYPGAMNHLSAQEVGDDMLKRARHLHVSSIFMQSDLRKGILDLFRRAKSLGLSTSLDPQWDPEEVWDLDLKNLLPYVDIFFPNKGELLGLTGAGSIEEGVKSLDEQANIIAVKDGANGAVLWSKGVMKTKSAFLNDAVVDCIGAGDSFDAGFVFQFLQNRSLDDCLEFANLTGAINTTEAGGTQAFESKERIAEIAFKHFSYKI